MQAALLMCVLLALPTEGNMRPEPGQEAPAFSAPSTEGGTIELSSFAGKKTVILAFYPKAFTGG